MNLPLPLRLTLPVVLLIFSAATAWIAHHSRFTTAFQRERREMLDRIQSQSERIARLSALLGDPRYTFLLRAELEALNNTPSFEGAAVLDVSLTVIAASEPSWIGSKLSEIPELASSAAFNPTENAPRGLAESGEQTTAVFATPALTLAGKPAGTVILQHSLRGRIAAAQRDARQQIVWILGAFACLGGFIWAFLHFSLSSRIAQLVRTTRAFAEENGPTPQPISGSDEVAEISRAFAFAARTLRQREDRLHDLARSLTDKNRELESIVYVTSHDLRSPLVNVQGFSEELRLAANDLSKLVRKYPTPERSETISHIIDERIPEAVRFIDAGVGKMDSLLKGLLRVSRLGNATLNLQRIHVRPMLDGLVRAMEFQLLKAGARIHIDQIPDCVADAAQLSQVFANLLDNALKYRHPDRPLRIRVEGEETDSETIYRVRDNGIGIAKEHQTRVFEMFHRLEPRATSGEGLGLTIAEKALFRHRGKLTLESNPGEGSTFIVTLPSPRCPSPISLRPQSLCNQ